MTVPQPHEMSLLDWIVFIALMSLVIGSQVLRDRRVRRSGRCEVGCGRAQACRECMRCDSRECNAGCISCRPRNEWDPLSRSINNVGRRFFK